MNPQTGSPAPVPPPLKRPPLAVPLWFGMATLALLVLGGLLVIYFFDPAATALYPGCAFHRVTGLNCPGCGATRGMHALLHGDWRRALKDNALVMLTGVVLLARAGWLGVERQRERPVASLIPTWSLIPWLVLALVFGVVRNLPMGAWLSP